MIKEIRFKNWKSFRDATLYIDPLTILIGTNASGKSNALDGIAFLSKISQGKDLQTALVGESSSSAATGIRGGVEWAARKPENEFALEVVSQERENIDYVYQIKVKTVPLVTLLQESLSKIEILADRQKKTELFSFDKSKSSIATGFNRKNHSDIPDMIVKIRGVSNSSFLSSFRIPTGDDEFFKSVGYKANQLDNIFILDPSPSTMREYKPLSDHLTGNASNVAGVLAALPQEQKEQIESKLSSYVSKLPEGEVKKVWAETVGRFHNDAMLYCEEQWSDGQTQIVDARGMSDGTLRFIGILTALLTRPEGSLIVIEEVDNGLHPSRANMLLQLLKEIGSERKIDILVTTHNPALMDALGPEMIPFVMVAHRSPITGESLLTPLDDLQNMPKLLASGSIGKMATRGEIEAILAEQEEASDAQ